MAAALLGFFFGPFGLLYVGVMPALIMFFIVLVVAAATMGIGLIFVWPLCAIVGWSRANYCNKKMRQGA